MNIFEDVLHTDCLGVRLNANGGVLWELAKMGHWGPVPDGPWKESMNVVLRAAFNNFAEWMEKKKLRCNITVFNCNLLGMHVQTDWPTLKTKAAAAATVTEWLCPIVEKIAAGGNHLDRMRACDERMYACM